MLVQPFHADTDIDERMLQLEQVFRATVARIPTKKSKAARGHQRRDVVLREVDIVVRRDDRNLRHFSGWRPIKTLARVAARTGARRRGRGKADKAKSGAAHAEA